MEQKFLALQTETCANIAGRIVDDHLYIRSQDGQSEIAELIVGTYLPFLGSEPFLDILREISHDPIRGHFWYYEGFDYKLVDWLRTLNLQIPSAEKRKEWGSFVISTYLDPSGQIAQMRSAATHMIAEALYEFGHLEEIRRSAQVALFELADIPIPQWPEYIRSQVSEENQLA